MTIQLQAINELVPVNIRQRIRRRIMKLATYNDKIISANVVLKKDNESNDKGHHCEMRLAVKGPDLFAKNKAANFEQSASLVIESLRKQLRKKNTIKIKQRRARPIVFRGS